MGHIAFTDFISFEYPPNYPKLPAIWTACTELLRDDSLMGVG
jgi:hypothetical protein